MTSRRTKISPKSGRGLGHVTPAIFGSTVGYPSDSLASCSRSLSMSSMSHLLLNSLQWQRQVFTNIIQYHIC